MNVYILKKFETRLLSRYMLTQSESIRAFTHLQVHPLSCSVAYTALTQKIHVYANVVKWLTIIFTG